eukprot:TRINITY_DN8805_c0_g1_i6.p1 TRINITY_DN8805_c0_g1~~TRINITY_DN8805_c0_g1_i6.p1  ORF type:complete len:269 (+),score=70.94 TRINITY_DN8805_c0_g1_i6:256-1062(+)
MAEEDIDDYMSDSLLLSLEAEPKPRKGKRAAAKRANASERPRSQPKKRHVLEQEHRDKGLQTKLSSDNKGFKMLQAMGYKGGALGTANRGIVEPIGIDLKTDKSGLGKVREQRQAAIATNAARQARQEADAEQRDRIAQDFAARQRQHQLLKLDERDLTEAQQLCYELDHRKGLDQAQPGFWPELDVDKGDDEVIASPALGAAPSAMNQDPATEPDEPNGDPIEPSLLLGSILQYLRAEHAWCMYCGASLADIAQDCPGATRQDHDDI